MTRTAIAGPSIADAHQDVIRAALPAARFAEIKAEAMEAGADVLATFDAELTAGEKTRIREALDGEALDHDAIAAVLGADRYREIWSPVLMPSTPDAQRDAVIRAALERELTTAEREALNPTPADDWAAALGMTEAELAAVPAAETEAPAPARKPTPAGLRASTKRVAGGADGRDWSFVGVVRLGRAIVAECGHLHANRDWPTGTVTGSAKSCAERILDGARRPAAAEHNARQLRTAPLGLHPAAGFQHPAGTIEAAREIAEKNEASYLAAVVAVREHLDTLEEPLPDTDPAGAAPTATDGPAPRCLDAGPSHTCDSVPQFRAPLSGTGESFPRCNAAWSARLDLQDRHRRDYPDSPVPPRWWTEQGGEAYAGERWDED
jgi:hypothetical protein